MVTNKKPFTRNCYLLLERLTSETPKNAASERLYEIYYQCSYSPELECKNPISEDTMYFSHIAWKNYPGTDL